MIPPAEIPVLHLVLLYKINASLAPAAPGIIVQPACEWLPAENMDH